MIIIMAVSFYTVRVILDTLGVTDFGLYSLVASFVMIIAFLNDTTVKKIVCLVDSFTHGDGTSYDSSFVRQFEKI